MSEKKKVTDRAEIPDHVKRRIVVELARFRRTAEVSAMLREEYELDVPAKQLAGYDPNKSYTCVGHALANLFHETRREFVQSTTGLHLAPSACGASSG
jgi:hypothetical protein